MQKLKKFGFGKSWYRWVILLACIIVYTTSHLVRWNYSSITKFLVVDLNIGKPELGVLGAAFFYSYAVVQIPWGMAADKFGARKVIPFAIFLLGFALAGFAFSATYTQAIVWRAAMGIVAATGYVSINSIVSRWFSIRERGLAMSLFSGIGGGVGEVLSFVLIPVVAIFMSAGVFGMTGWRASTIIMGVIISIMAVITIFMLRDDPSDLGLPSIQKTEDKRPDQTYQAAASESMKDPVLWLFSVILSCYIVGCRIGPAWLPLYATEFYIESGMSKEMAIIAGGSMATMYVLGRCFGSPFVGQISDMLLRRYHVPRSILMAAAMIVQIILCFTLTQHIGNYFFMGFIIFMCGTTFNSFPILNAATPELLSVKTAGFSTAVINTTGQFVGAATLSASGYLAVKYTIEGGSFHLGFVGIWYLGIIAGVVGLIAALMVIPRERRRLHERIKENQI